MNAPHGVFAPTRRLHDKVISPASVDHGWRCTTRRAAGVDDVTGLTVAGVAEADIGAVDVSPRLGRAARAGLRRRCPEAFSSFVNAVLPVPGTQTIAAPMSLLPSEIVEMQPAMRRTGQPFRLLRVPSRSTTRNRAGDHGHGTWPTRVDGDGVPFSTLRTRTSTKHGSAASAAKSTRAGNPGRGRVSRTRSCCTSRASACVATTNAHASSAHRRTSSTRNGSPVGTACATCAVVVSVTATASTPVRETPTTSAPGSSSRPRQACPAVWHALHAGAPPIAPCSCDVVWAFGAPGHVVDGGNGTS